MTTVVWWGYSPELDETHLLAGICCFKEIKLRRGKRCNIYAMARKYDLSRMLICLRRLGRRARGLLRYEVSGVVVVLRDGVDDGLFSLWGLRRRSNVCIVQGEVAVEKVC
jgi:hypothetical protein